MTITLPWFNFFRLWMLTPLLGSLITSVTLWISITKQSPKFADIGIVAYWLLLGIFQWRVLKPHVSWAYQWGLITSLSGITIFWFSGFLWILIITTSDQSLKSEELLQKYLINPGASLYFLPQLLLYYGRLKLVTLIPLIVFFLGGILFSSSQLLLLLFKGVPGNIKFPIFSGVAWLLGYIVYVIGFIFSFIVPTPRDNYSASMFGMIFTSMIFTYLNGVIGSYLKGSILYKILNDLNTRT